MKKLQFNKSNNLNTIQNLKTDQIQIPNTTIRSYSSSNSQIIQIIRTNTDTKPSQRYLKNEFYISFLDILFMDVLT